MVTWNPEWPGFNRRLPTPEGEEPKFGGLPLPESR